MCDFESFIAEGTPFGDGGSNGGSTSVVIEDAIKHSHLVGTHKSGVLPSAESKLLLSQVPASNQISVLFLYCRDDPHISRHAADLRKQLQSEYGHQLKVIYLKLKNLRSVQMRCIIQIYDYGDEAQWEEMAIEGVDWLPNRICCCRMEDRNLKRVIVIHSPRQQACSRLIEMELEKNSHKPEKLHTSGESNSEVKPAFNGTSFSNIGNTNYQTDDKDFLYGMQILLSCLRESCSSSNEEKQPCSLYRRVFNVR